MRVSYAVCKESTYERLKSQDKLVQGRLYFIRDTGEIFRGTSVNTAEPYSYNYRLVEDEFPNPGKLDRIYIRPSDGRIRMWCNVNGSEMYVDLDGSQELLSVWEAINELRDQLQWKTP